MRAHLLIPTLALLGAACVTTPSPGPQAPPTGGAPISFELPVYKTDRTYRLEQDRGKVVLVDIWASWCEPCRKALPVWEALGREHHRRGLRVYALNVDEDLSAVERFLAQTRVHLPVLLDPEGKVAEEIFKLTVMPSTYLIDRAGVLRFVHPGFAADQLPSYRQQIELLLNEPVRQPPEQPAEQPPEQPAEPQE